MNKIFSRKSALRFLNRDSVPHKLFRAATLVTSKSISKEISENQAAILDLYNRSKKQVVLNPVTLLGGSVEHYYHFVFELLLPLQNLIDNSPASRVFNFRPFGPMTNLLNELHGNRVNIVEEKHADCLDTDLIGMDPVGLRKSDIQFDAFRKYVFKKFEVPSNDNPDLIIIIERAMPEEYFLSEAKIKGGGKLRRSLTNHNTMQKIVRDVFSKRFKVVNMVLEHMTFAEQVRAFNQAFLVVGLHGAGLANSIWMNEKSYVVEIGYRDRKHFQLLSQVMDHQHHVFQRSKSSQVTLDHDLFESWLRSIDFSLKD